LKVVIDADVLIGALDSSDPHHPNARALFTGWETADTARLISAVNLTEVLVAPAADNQRLRTAREAIAALGVTVHQPAESVGVEAARLRFRYRISLADAYCLATARHTGSSVASFDRTLIRAAHAEQIAHTASETS
jgi:predicted nucleic acid-binding protein